MASGKKLVVFVYALFGVTWIIGSDWLLSVLTDNPATVLYLQSFKGITFILLSSALIYALLLHEHNHSSALKADLDALQCELTRLLNKSEGLIWGIDFTRNELHLSPRLRQFLGDDVPVGTLEPQEIRRFIHPEDKAAFDAEIKRIRSDVNEPFNLECRIITDHSPGVWCHLRGFLFQHSPQDNREHFLYGTLTDISERHHFHEELSRSNRALLALSSCNRAIISAAKPDHVYDAACHTLHEHAGYPLVWVGVLEPNTMQVVPVAGIGLDLAALARVGIKWDDSELSECATGLAARTGKTHVANDTQNKPNYKPWRAIHTEHKIRSSLALPVQLPGQTQPHAVLTICAGEIESFGAQEIIFLETLASDIAHAIHALSGHERASLTERQLAVTLSKFKETFISSASALSRAIELRDPYTSGHQARVADIALTLGKSLGLSEYALEGLRLAALIHDVGKIAVPAEILNKPSALNDEERAIVHKHPEYSARIIKDIDFPWPIQRILMEHHERYDGTGYPNKLKGEAILLESHILAVADAYDAMCSDRPYRRGQAPDRVVAEIVYERGHKFHPQVVDALVRYHHDYVESRKEAA